MKAIFTFASFLLINLIGFPSQATVFRVNNKLPTAVNQKLYNTIKEAHDDFSVKAGDTLMVEGSSEAYATVTLTKRLVLIGPGYFLTENPQTQANPAQAISLGIGIEAQASGTIIKGFTFASGSSNYSIFIEANNIIVMRCHLPYPIGMPAVVENIQIIQNYFESSALSLGSTNYRFSNVVLKNNVVGNTLSIASENNYQRLFSAVENNIFLGNVGLTTASFRNNIIVNRNATVTISSNNIQNNLVSNGQITTGNGNITYDAQGLFVGPTGNSTDGQYRLRTDSPYLTAGFGGTEPGIFGGTMPYVLSGIAPLPTIYEFSADGFGTKQSGLPISIKVKAN